MMPRWCELMLMALGAWTALCLAVLTGMSVVRLCIDWRQQRATRRAVIEHLIRDARVGSRWFDVEPRGRG